MVRNIFTLFLVLYPILSAYIVFAPIDLGVILCTVSGLMALVVDRFKIKWPNGYKPFLVYLFFSSLLVTQAIPLRIALYSFLLILGCSYCQLFKLLQCYKKVAIVCILFFVFQEIMRIFLGIKISGIFSFLPLVYGDANTYISNVIMESDRSSSFFLEPSYFAQYLYPLVVIELFYNREKSYLQKAGLLSLIIFLIRSGNGLILLSIIWCAWLFVSNVKRKVKIYILLGGFLIFCGILIYNPDIVLEIVNRSDELSLANADEQYQSSGFIRFFRGYYLYGTLPLVNQLFGINPIILESYIYMNTLGLFNQDVSFLNGIQTVLCQYGFIGLVLVLFHIYSYGKNGNIICYVLLSGVIFLLLSESYFISSRMLVVMILTYIVKYDKANIV